MADPTTEFQAYDMKGAPIEMAFDLRLVWYIQWTDRGEGEGGGKDTRWEATVWNTHDHDYMEFLVSEDVKVELTSQWRDVIREGAGITVP